MPCLEPGQTSVAFDIFKSDENKLIISDVMSELVNGTDIVSKFSSSIVIFGSARTNEQSKYYSLAYETAKAIAKKGFGITTGGGPGIMEAANKGAREVGQSSNAVKIKLNYERKANRFVDKENCFDAEYLFIRKVLLISSAKAFVIFPGGFGTIDELFEVITLIQNKKFNKMPIVLMGKEFWADLIAWIKNKVLAENYLSENDLELIQVSDNPIEAAEFICSFYNNKGKEF